MTTLKEIHENAVRMLERIETKEGWDEGEMDILIAACEEQTMLFRELESKHGIFRVLWIGTLRDYWAKSAAPWEPPAVA